METQQVLGEVYRMMGVLTEAISKMTEAQTKMTEAQTQNSIDRWDSLDKYRTIKVFSGKPEEWDEFSRKLRNRIGAGNQSVLGLMDEAALEAAEKDIVDEDWDMLTNSRLDNDTIGQMSHKLLDLLTGLTTGEANAVVARCQSNGLLAWRRLCTSLNPRTLASGVKAISVVLNPGKSRAP